MRWDTAVKCLVPKDGDVITHSYYGTRIHIPSLRNYRLVDMHEIVSEYCPDVMVDSKAINDMLDRANIPPTGWLPGYLQFSPYGDRKIFHEILKMVRVMSQDNGCVEVSIVELRNKFAVDDRLFKLHVLNLIEDYQGLVAIDDAHIRMATWGEAMYISSHQLVKYTSRPVSDDVIQPGVNLRLDDSYTGCSWRINAYGNGLFDVLQLAQPYVSHEGDAASVDHFLTQYQLPNGWAANYGYNASLMERSFNDLKKNNLLIKE